MRQGLDFDGSPGRTRTADKVVNSHPLYQLSYRGIISISTRWLIPLSAGLYQLSYRGIISISTRWLIPLSAGLYLSHSR